MTFFEASNFCRCENSKFNKGIRLIHKHSCERDGAEDLRKTPEFVFLTLDSRPTSNVEGQTSDTWNSLNTEGIPGSVQVVRQTVMLNDPGFYKVGGFGTFAITVFP